MAEKRNLAKRNGQVKLIHDMILKEKQILDDDSRSRNPEKEVAALVKNIKAKKISVDG